MNKVLFTLLFVCLISVAVQAFVKRDAPAPTTGTPDKLQEVVSKIQEIGKQAGEKIQENLNPDKIKETLADLQKTIEEGLESLKKSTSGTTTH